MRKILPVLVALGMMMPATAQAQTDGATMSATATIEAFLSVSKVSDVAFGTIAAAASALLSPGGAPGTGQTLGVLQMVHNSTVDVDVALPAGGLTHTTNGAAPNLPVTFTCGYSTLAAGALDGTAVACGSLADRAANGDGTNATSFIQVGGSISSGDTTNRLPGLYSGDLVFTVTSVIS